MTQTAHTYRTAGHVNATRCVSRWERLLHDVRLPSDSLRLPLEAVEAVLQERAVDPAANPTTELGRVSTLARAASAEIYAGLYSGTATPLESAAPDTEWVTKIHEQLAALPNYQALVANVKGDPDLAAVATGELLAAVVPLLPAMLGNDQETKPQSRREARREARKAANEPSTDQELRAAMGAACTKAGESTAEAREALANLAPGLDETPAAHEQDSAERLRLAELLLADEDVRHAMLLAGRLRRVSASSRKERDPNGCSELVGITQGADLARVLPTELALMRHPATRMLQLSKLAERKLAQYKLVGTTPLGRGPVVVALDLSGSMGLHNRHTWAVAVALACLGTAARERRACTVIGFNAGIVYCLRLDAEGTAWEHNQHQLANPTKLAGGCAELSMRIATKSPRGGTRFAPPMQLALDLEDGVTKDRADLVLVTDGQADLPHGIMDRLDAAKANGMRVFGLTVGGGSLGKAVAHLCDHVAELDTQDAQGVGSVLP